MNYMLDACSLLALLNREPGMLVVKDLLLQTPHYYNRLLLQLVSYKCPIWVFGIVGFC